MVICLQVLPDWLKLLVSHVMQLLQEVSLLFVDAFNHLRSSSVDSRLCLQ
jgi:hypothetical protein